ncbi:hypothetical protein BB559_000616 [Furculomyces boomerangus]|uniref:Cyclin-like domain-containing protein n=2 Tax=Harpellales TaxID=61421 RepID=A0A2T9Z4U1_9FUNG|nr:hypothetical protein BB559_000616 [Furculomyces boomerangus]
MQSTERPQIFKNTEISQISKRDAVKKLEHFLSAMPAGQLAPSAIRSQLTKIKESLYLSILTKTMKNLYEQASQYKSWRFSKEGLLELRKNVNSKGIEAAKKSHAMEKQLKDELDGKMDVDSTGPDGQKANDNQNKNVISDSQFLTFEEEQEYVSFYETKIRDFAKAFKLSQKVKATAVMYMKRFYLHNTVLDYQPKQILLVCLFLSAKAENQFMSIEEFTKHQSKTSPADIIDLELILCQSLRFDLAVIHPYNAAYGYYLDLQEYVTDFQLLTKAHLLAISYIDTSLFTDVGLIFQPSQVAIACWKLATIKINNSSGPGSTSVALDFDGYLSKKISAKLLVNLYLIMDEIQQMITQYKAPSMETVKNIDRKLFYCKNPAKNSNSLLYKKLEEQKELAQKQKKKKADKGKNDDNTMDHGSIDDVFS